MSRVYRFFPVEAAAVFGSFARGEQTPESDVDVLAALSPGARMADLDALIEALEYACGRPVDVVTTLDGKTRRFRESVMRDARAVYG